MTETFWTLSQESNCLTLVSGSAAMIPEIQRPSVRRPPSRRHRLQEDFADSSKTFSKSAENKSFKRKKFPKRDRCIDDSVSQSICLLHSTESGFIGSVKEPFKSP